MVHLFKSKNTYRVPMQRVTLGWTRQLNVLVIHAQFSVIPPWQSTKKIEALFEPVTSDATDIRIRGYPIKISHTNPKIMWMKTRRFRFKENPLR